LTTSSSDADVERRRHRVIARVRCVVARGARADDDLEAEVVVDASY